MANSSMTEAQRQLGANLVTASLCLQAALFGAFGLLAAQFQIRATKARVLTKDLRTVLYVLYVSATIVTIRCIYRLAEYIEGELSVACYLYHFIDTHKAGMVCFTKTKFSSGSSRPSSCS